LNKGLSKIAIHKEKKESGRKSGKANNAGEREKQKKIKEELKQDWLPMSYNNSYCSVGWHALKQKSCGFANIHTKLLYLD
jgi:hypothetical protein